MLVVLVTHNVQFGKNLSRNLFCDARLTKDGVALIPVHKIILASFSSKFKRMFESQDQRDLLTVVPVVDFPNLKRVINFIYDSRVTLHSKEELDDFLDALSILKVEVEHTVTTMKPSGRGELEVVDVKHYGADGEAVESLCSEQESSEQDSSQERGELEALRQEALSSLVKVESRRAPRDGSSSNLESPGQRRLGRESSSMRRSKGRKIGGSNTCSGGSETENWCKNTERAGGFGRGEKGNRERAKDFHSKKTRNSESEGRFVVGRSDAIPEGDLRLKLAKRKREEESSPHRDLRHKIQSKKCCAFSEEESCNCRRFSHGQHSRRKQNNQERLSEVGGEFIYLKDKTCTVETVDLEEHFSKDRDVAKVKFVGKRGGSNIFKVVVTATWQSNQMRSFYRVRGVELEVESKIQREYTGNNLSGDGQKLRSGGRFEGEAERTHGRGKAGWWETQRGTRENWEVKEANTVQKEDQQAHPQSGTRDLQVELLPDAVPATVSEASVESFLKGFRSQVEMKDEKRELLLKVGKEIKEDDVKVKEEREHKAE